MVQYLTIEDIRKTIESADFVVTDTNVRALYPDLLKGAYAVTAGEASKSVDCLLALLSEMMKAGVNRKSVVCAVGGGVVGDLTGFAAAIYMRGITWVSVPTTLLAMVDSGMGGKTGVDFNGAKNILGAFYQAQDTLIALDFLKTLPEREWRCGVGEAIKTLALTKEGGQMLDDNIIDCCKTRIEEIVKQCVKTKGAIVERDEREAGERKFLNFGHTVSHAYESADNFKLSHGEYVIFGMAAELQINRAIVDADFYKKFMKLLTPYLPKLDVSVDDVCRIVKYDKKNSNGKIVMAIVTDYGKYAEVAMTPKEFERAIKELK